MAAHARRRLGFSQCSQRKNKAVESDLRKRSVIEGRIGRSKRKYGLDRILTKLIATSRSVIGITFFVINSEKILSLLSMILVLLVSVCKEIKCLLAISYSLSIVEQRVQKDFRQLN